MINDKVNGNGESKNRWSMPVKDGVSLGKLPEARDAQAALPRTKKPLIPEPRHRVGPKGVSSGVSFRKLPDTSLQAIINICSHYEAKCSGKYETLASRYLFQMGREVLSQVYALAEAAKEDEKVFQELEGAVHEWNEHFGDLTVRKDSKENSNSNDEATEKPVTKMGGIAVPVTPADIKAELLRQRGRIKELEEELKASKEETNKLREFMKQEIDTHVQVFRKSAETDRIRHKAVLTEMKQQCDKDVEEAKSVLQRTVMNSKQSIKFLQQKAEEAIAKSEAKRHSDVSALRENFSAIEQRMKRDFNIERARLKKKINGFDKRLHDAVSKAQTDLHRQHCIETADLKRQLAILNSKVKVEAYAKEKRNMQEKEAVNLFRERERIISEQERKSQLQEKVHELEREIRKEKNIGKLSKQVQKLHQLKQQKNRKKHFIAPMKDMSNMRDCTKCEYYGQCSLLELQRTPTDDEYAMLRDRVTELENWIDELTTTLGITTTHNISNDPLEESSKSSSRDQLSCSWTWADLKRCEQQRKAGTGYQGQRAVGAGAIFHRETTATI